MLPDPPADAEPVSTDTADVPSDSIESIYGTWNLYSFNDSTKIESRVTIQKGSIIKSIGSPDTEFAKDYMAYYKIKEDDKLGLVRYYYDDEQSFNEDKGNSPVAKKISQMIR
ncbi:hypothetical protein [Paenibacillus ihuae]|uniref:hypothetical protein n=1 Tax=Paenibacillus ihuae TaxID=1232431 RepID=UPI00131D912F|nr:hypothetical protein [Paenibacillus ihuae]